MCDARTDTYIQQKHPLTYSAKSRSKSHFVIVCRLALSIHTSSMYIRTYVYTYDVMIVRDELPYKLWSPLTINGAFGQMGYFGPAHCEATTRHRSYIKSVGAIWHILQESESAKQGVNKLSWTPCDSLKRTCPFKALCYSTLRHSKQLLFGKLNILNKLLM